MCVFISTAEEKTEQYEEPEYEDYDIGMLYFIHNSIVKDETNFTYSFEVNMKRTEEIRIFQSTFTQHFHSKLR